MESTVLWCANCNRVRSEYKNLEQKNKELEQNNKELEQTIEEMKQKDFQATRNFSVLKQKIMSSQNLIAKYNEQLEECTKVYTEKLNSMAEKLNSMTKLLEQMHQDLTQREKELAQALEELNALKTALQQLESLLKCKTQELNNLKEKLEVAEAVNQQLQTALRLKEKEFEQQKIKIKQLEANKNKRNNQSQSNKLDEERKDLARNVSSLLKLALYFAKTLEKNGLLAPKSADKVKGMFRSPKSTLQILKSNFNGSAKDLQEIFTIINLNKPDPHTPEPIESSDESFEEVETEDGDEDGDLLAELLTNSQKENTPSPPKIHPSPKKCTKKSPPTKKFPPKKQIAKFKNWNSAPPSAKTMKPSPTDDIDIESIFRIMILKEEPLSPLEPEVGFWSRTAKSEMVLSTNKNHSIGLDKERFKIPIGHAPKIEEIPKQKSERMKSYGFGVKKTNNSLAAKIRPVAKQCLIKFVSGSDGIEGTINAEEKGKSKTETEILIGNRSDGLAEIEKPEVAIKTDQYDALSTLKQKQLSGQTDDLAKSNQFVMDACEVKGFGDVGVAISCDSTAGRNEPEIGSNTTVKCDSASGLSTLNEKSVLFADCFGDISDPDEDSDPGLWGEIEDLLDLPICEPEVDDSKEVLDKLITSVEKIVDAKCVGNSKPEVRSKESSQIPEDVHELVNGLINYVSVDENEILSEAGESVMQQSSTCKCEQLDISESRLAMDETIDNSITNFKPEDGKIEVNVSATPANSEVIDTLNCNLIQEVCQIKGQEVEKLTDQEKNDILNLIKTENLEPETALNVESIEKPEVGDAEDRTTDHETPNSQSKEPLELIKEPKEPTGSLTQSPLTSPTHCQPRTPKINACHNTLFISNEDDINSSPGSGRLIIALSPEILLTPTALSPEVLKPSTCQVTPDIDNILSSPESGNLLIDTSPEKKPSPLKPKPEIPVSFTNSIKRTRKKRLITPVTIVSSNTYWTRSRSNTGVRKRWSVDGLIEEDVKVEENRKVEIVEAPVEHQTKDNFFSEIGLVKKDIDTPKENGIFDTDFSTLVDDYDYFMSPPDGGKLLIDDGASSPGSYSLPSPVMSLISPLPPTPDKQKVEKEVNHVTDPRPIKRRISLLSSPTAIKIKPPASPGVNSNPETLEHDVIEAINGSCKRKIENFEPRQKKRQRKTKLKQENEINETQPVANGAAKEQRKSKRISERKLQTFKREEEVNQNIKTFYNDKPDLLTPKKKNKKRKPLKLNTVNKYNIIYTNNKPIPVSDRDKPRSVLPMHLTLMNRNIVSELKECTVDKSDLKNSLSTESEERLFNLVLTKTNSLRVVDKKKVLDGLMQAVNIGIFADTKIFGKASLCRFYCLLCKYLDKVESIYELCRDLLCKLTDVCGIIISNFIGFIPVSGEFYKTIQYVLLNYKVCVSSSVKTLLQSTVSDSDLNIDCDNYVLELLDKLRNNLGSNKTENYEWSVEIISAVKGWSWTSEFLIDKHLWPALKEWEASSKQIKENKNYSSSNDLFVVRVLRIFATVCQKCPKQESAAAISRLKELRVLIKTLNLSSVPSFVQESIVETVIHLHEFRRDISRDVLGFWVPLNKHVMSNHLQTLISKISKKLNIEFVEIIEGWT